MVVLTRSKAKQVSNFEREVNAHTLGCWDQFDANKDLVKGTSTYNEDLYTTPLPPNPSAESLRRADAMVLSIANSREGETPDTGRQKTNTEEELFSSVRPTEDFKFQFAGAESSSLSLSKTKNKAVKGKCERHIRRSHDNEYDYEKRILLFPDLTPEDLTVSVNGCRKGRKKKKRPKGIALSQLSNESGADSEDRDNTEPSTNSPGPRTPALECVNSLAEELLHKEQNPHSSMGKRKRPQQVSKPGSCDSMKDEKLTQTPKTTRGNTLIDNEKTRECPFKGCTWKAVSHGGQWQAFYNHVAHRHRDEVPDT